MPRFLIDENLPQDLTEISRESGFRSRWVRDIEPGISDGEILRDVLGSDENLVTRDIGFANMVFARMALDDPVAGVVLIKEQRMHRIREAWNRFLRREQFPRRSLVVLEANRTRVRPLPEE